ncbi:hypothetical protein TSUD_56630 [Trifolium subterraneum]|uniref:Reverse transcriptase domain-containing protein n=1 Tax=Trifolium subterraneum TaxID=3900 RepID=A0A2Z6MUP4_TRISU|nr:hypothetical protein TSUD_56630 [Trifolium subterraneum]
MSIMVNGSPTEDFKFADDTVLVGEGSWENIWTIKDYLKRFRTCVWAEDIPFKFLGLPVGANPRRLITWKPVVESMTKRYKESFGNVLSWEGTISRSTDSFWWRDILKVGGMEGDLWFPKNVSSVLGNGKLIGFWKEKWLGEVPFSELFPNLFLKEIDPNVVVAKRLVRHRDDRSWYWQWRSILMQEEEDDLLYFQHLLLDVEVVVDRTDRWKWIPDHSGKFTVKSAYLILQNRKSITS